MIKEHRRASPMSRRVRGILAAAVVAAAAGVLAGCGSSAPPQNAATASLDAKHMQITFPLDRYGMDWREVRTVQYADEILIDECMKAQGDSNPKADPSERDKPPFPDWRYGLWNADYVAENGLGEGQHVDSAAVAAASNDEEWLSLYITCAQKDVLDLIDTRTVQQGDPPSALVVGSRDSYDQTIASSEAASIREAWAACVEKAGQKPAAKDSWAVYTDDSWSDAEKYKAYIASATCADRLHTVQKVADVEARYQQAYIDSHEAELVTLRDRAKKILAKAEKIIAGDG